MEMPQDGEICSVVFLCKNGRRLEDIWKKVREGGGKNFPDLGNPKKKKTEQLKRMDEITGPDESDKKSDFIFTDSDGSVIEPNSVETKVFIHQNYKG